jgi:glycosyltransferase involved in cell wall biosynthesis
MKYYPYKMRLLFLYTELSGYFIACLKILAEISKAEIMVIHWDINQEAPFNFTFPGNIQFIPKSTLKFNELVNYSRTFNPDFIYCSGWVDKDYLKIVSTFRKKIPTVIVLDNPWQNRIKQYIACILSRFTLLKIFTHCWVPGEKQRIYAIKLGFKKDNIRMGMYSADVEFYNRLSLKFQPEKRRNFPKRFIYAGRYTKLKGLPDLCKAFAEWKQENNGEWELWCLGTGDAKPAEINGIRHFGFIQPGNMESFIENTSVFIMPSHFEPWGVALHEFVSAGFPIICSDSVCSSELFVQDKQNGYIYSSGNIEELKKCISAITKKSTAELIKMSELSLKLSKSITPVTWSENIISLVTDNKNKHEYK